MKAFRGILVALLLLVTGLPVLTYLVLSSDWAQEKLCLIGSEQLSLLLGTDVKVGQVRFTPFNRLVIEDVKAADDNGATAMSIKSLDTRFEIWDLIYNHKIIIDYAEIIGLDLKLYKASPGAPLNIAKIVKRLKKEEQTDSAAVFKLRINDVRLLDCSFSYDVLSKPSRLDRFDPNHIKVKDIRLNVFAPVVSNDRYSVWIRSLSMREQSGFVLSDLTMQALLTQRSISVAGLKIELPQSILEFEDFDTPIRDLKHIATLDPNMRLDVRIKEGSHVCLSDLKAFVPAMTGLDYIFGIQTELYATVEEAEISSLTIEEPSGLLTAKLSGYVSEYMCPDSMSVSDMKFSVNVHRQTLSEILNHYPDRITPRAASIISALGNTRVAGKASGTIRGGKVDVDVRSKIADAKIDGTFTRNPATNTVGFDVVADIDSISLASFVPDKGFGGAAATINTKGAINGRRLVADATIIADYFDYRNYRYTGINAKVYYDPTNINGVLDVDDGFADISANVDYRNVEGEHNLSGRIDVQRVRLDTLNLVKGHTGYDLSGSVEVTAEGRNVDEFKADVTMRDVTYRNDKKQGLRLNKFYLSADNSDRKGRVDVTSDYINGWIDGRLRPSSLAADIKNVVKSIIPALAPDLPEMADKAIEAHHEEVSVDGPSNSFAFDFTLANTDHISKFLNLPVTVIGDASLLGHFNSDSEEFFLYFDVPWLQQGGSIIENTSLVVDLNGCRQDGKIHLTSLIPTKKGDMDVTTSIEAKSGRLDTKIDWKLERSTPINGEINFSTSLHRDPSGLLFTTVDLQPGKINFGDEIWTIQPSHIRYGNNMLSVNDFSLKTGLQEITIDGVAGPNDTDSLYVDLKNIELINIFETLEIDKALIGGQATGIIKASALLSAQPVVNCDKLSVKSIGYNYCTLGDADVMLSLDDCGKVFNFSAVVLNDEKEESYLYGAIKLPTEELDLKIKAEHVKVGFMKPFMEAFTSDVQGYVSGDAHLFGTFKEIDLTGDVYASDLKIKIDFTNTWYSASDSIHLRPGCIKLDSITLFDEYNHTANLKGEVKHEYFHNASFDFHITDADRFLCYDVSKKQSPDWYGRIFGSGEATVKGKPGSVEISAHMTTQTVTVKGVTIPSTFTFELSDRREAEEFSFIKFNDVTPHNVAPDSILNASRVPEKVRSIRENKADDGDETPTSYKMNIDVDVTPEAELVIVMDPVGGDEIRCHGRGSLSMKYESISNVLELFGMYNVERGDYRFTLQDIIIKPFTIYPNSWIKFSGNPYDKTTLGLKVYSQVNAKLTDLDESFLQDKEVARTGVPVRAVVDVTGMMLQPTIKFDIELPTLSEDTNRKLHSIVSTEDMMSRQIIYLLALNRFYTPEYMASTTKGNELFSVASSTLSSQLSNMLGKLSDNWSIAPNLRSDKGDFSDLEVDLTLSSTLLNNRLLFNGNFGYRDKSLNTNQFIGDFELEYLLNQSGEWRLKAYNRYNDQNYYLRTAQTTQGVGIIYRKDFNHTMRFIRSLFKKDKKKDKLHSDSIEIKGIIQQNDSSVTLQDTITIN